MRHCGSWLYFLWYGIKCVVQENIHTPPRREFINRPPYPSKLPYFSHISLCKFVFSLTPFPQEFTIPSTEGMNIFWNYTIDHIRILTIGLELPCNKGPGGGIFSNANIFNDIPPHEPLLQASSSPILRIRIWLILNHMDCFQPVGIHMSCL